MYIKNGVTLFTLKPQIVLAVFIADTVFRHYTNEKLCITSGDDGKHMEGSKHYTGEAVDIRRPKNFMFNNDIDMLVKDLATSLGEGYDVVLENFHIHIEYDPPTVAF